MHVLKYLQSWWETISNIGISDDDEIPYIEQKKVKVLNQGIAIGILFQAIVSSSYVLGFKVEGLLISVLVIVLLFILSFLNSKKRYKTTQLLVNILFPFVMMVLGVLYGNTTGIQYNLIIFIMTAFFFQQTNIIKFSLTVYNISIYFILRYYWANYESMFADIVSPITEPITFITSVIITITIVFTFLKENEKFTEKNQLLLQSLAENNAELKTVNEELERFAYIASHDLKTPLRTISGYIKLLERDFDKGKMDNFPIYFREITNGAMQMNNLIKTTLEYSRISHIEDEKTWIDLNVAMKSIQNAYANEEHIQITFVDLPTIYGEENQILSLFQNLIENGLKYNEQVQKTIDITCETSTDKYLFIIKDNGIGIAEQFHEQIFTMFKRLHANQKYEGTGLGLAICAKIIANLNGRIWLESEVGKGTTFFVELQ